MVLKRPMRAACSRRSRLRAALAETSCRAISSSNCRCDHFCLIAREIKSSRPSAVALNLIRSRRPAKSSLLALTSFIINLQVLSRDREVLEMAKMRVMREIYRQSHTTALPPAAFENERQRIRPWRLSLERFLNRGVQLAGAVIVQQLDQFFALPADLFAAGEGGV